MSRRVKVLAALLLTLVLGLSAVCTAFAWDTPQMKLTADYRKSSGRITVYYIVSPVQGIEAADFRLKYQSDKVEYVSCETKPISRNNYIETGDDPANDVLRIQFVDMYHISPEDCPDNEATILTAQFRVKDGAAGEAAFSAFTESCSMDPDSHEVIPDRFTLKVDLSGDVKAEPASGEGAAGAKGKLWIVIAAAACAAAVLVIAIAVFVRRTNKSDPPPKSPAKKKPKQEEDSFAIEEKAKKAPKQPKEEPGQPAVFDPDADLSDYNSDKFTD